ncbi:twin-arginine translocase TatA/TatE family subunit [Nisaea nitritireducens]|uniref:twin-arginine translocase TatA/TatE family subunit n=1 Tax=Nisaea nitritireducens TaxID=568392 RepID=UPI0018678BD1|nr:twin-arginine translocase TatA/TatE family subunit [Nisaea nitritireducens]
MGFGSIWHWLVVLLVVVVLFGGSGKISSLMGDFGKGLRNFKKSIKDEDGDQASEGDSAKTLNSEQSAAAQPKADEAQKS